MNISAFTVVRRQVWDRPLEKAEMVPGGLGTAGNGGAGAGSLGNAIERGLKEVAVESVTALLKEKEALDVINEEIIPALDHVGKGFEKGTVSFLSC